MGPLAASTFVRPSLTYGPFNLGKDDNLLTTQQDLTGSRTCSTCSRSP